MTQMLLARIVPLMLVLLGVVVLGGCGADATATPTATQPSQATATPTPSATVPGQPIVPTPTRAATPTPTATPDQSFDAAAFFSGRTITIIDGFSPGGGSDTLARLFARFAGRYFPGSPRFVIRNIPGAGGLRGLQETLRSDGAATSGSFTLGMMHNRFVKRALAGQEVEGFNLAETKWIGVPDLGRTYRALYVQRSIATSWEEALASGKVLTVGGTAPGDTAGAGAALVQAVGGPIKFVYGYGGSSEIRAAFDRGELDAIGSASKSTVLGSFPSWIEDQYFVPLFYWGQPVPQEYLDLLNAEEPIHLYDTWPMTDLQKEVFDAIENVNLLSSRTFLVPPNTPDPVYQAVLEAWEATVTDPEFIQAKLVGGYEEQHITASEIREIIAASRNLPPDGLALFAQLAGATE